MLSHNIPRTILIIIFLSIQTLAGTENDSTTVEEEKSITIPAGTRLMVKLDKPINTAQNKAGSILQQY